MSLVSNPSSSFPAGHKRSRVSATLPVSAYETPEELGGDLASAVLSAVGSARDRGSRFVLGCPSGRSLMSTYRAMGEQAAREGADLSHLAIAMMDEYVLRTGAAYAPCPADAHYSCHRYAHKEIRAVLNLGLGAAKGVAEASVWLPDPTRPAAYEAHLRDSGGVDLFLLASGASDGHIAFNAPGSARDSRCRVVELAETTRRDNLATFPQFATIDEVPRHGVTVGLGTIAEASKEVVLVMHGSDKRITARRVLTAAGFTPDWPATIVLECANPRVVLDRAAQGAGADPLP